MLVKRMDAIRRKLERMEAVDDQVRPVPHCENVTKWRLCMFRPHYISLVVLRNWIACITAKPDVWNRDAVDPESCNVKQKCKKGRDSTIRFISWSSPSPVKFRFLGQVLARPMNTRGAQQEY